MLDGWSRPITAVGTCKACERTDVPVGSAGRLLAHWKDLRNAEGFAKYRVRCWWAGRKAQNIEPQCFRFYCRDGVHDTECPAGDVT